jgi:chromosomal replication initiator protein
MFINMDTKQLWEKILVQLELSVSEASYNSWLKASEITKIDDGVVYIGTDNVFARGWLVTNGYKPIFKALREIDSSFRSIEFVIVDKKPEKERTSLSKNEAIDQKTTKALPLDEAPTINREDNLNPKYTFESFVVGPFNELAYAACQTIIKKPVAYNPLFIYGNTGLGKTHIMQAVGNYIKNSSHNKKVFYVTSERFTQDMFDAIQANKMNFFKEKYRKYDVFMMDDIQFISNKEKTQEELFTLFNYLYENNKQIIFTSDTHPNMIPNLEKRLKSRMMSGMVVDVPEPGYESRMEIIKKKVVTNNAMLQQETIEFLASNIEGNVREIEGALNNIFHYMDVKGKEPTIQEVKNLIKINKKAPKNLSVKEVVRIVSEFYNVDVDLVYDKSRKKDVVRPRQVIMYLLREVFNVSYPSIGQKLGGRDHTTVIHSCDKIKEDIKVDAQLASELAELKRLL